MRVYRITSAKWAQKLTASGFSARWNSEGIFVIYTAENRSLACLENLVHRNGYGLSSNFCTMTIEIPNDIYAAEVTHELLDLGWQIPDENGYGICRELGDRWFRECKFCILKVPSAIIPDEFNILINPSHKDFSKIVIKSIEKFTFDQRFTI